MKVENNLFDIKHHSASTINSFIEYRHQWFLQKIRKVPLPIGHAAIRGKAVEEGINCFLRDDIVEDCVKAGLKVWSEEILAIGENFDIRQSIGRCIDKGIDSFITKGYNDGNTSMQNKISITLEGCDLPTIGYLDYLRPDRIIDNKCVSKSPTIDKSNGLAKHKQGYIIQAAIYKAATGLEPYFHYIIPLKDEVKIIESRFTESDLEWGLKLATRAAQSIEKILSSIIDGDLFQAMMFPNPDAIYDGQTFNIVAKEYGL